jgi:hypothetical protein
MEEELIILIGMLLRVNDIQVVSRQEASGGSDQSLLVRTCNSKSCVR